MEPTTLRPYWSDSQPVVAYVCEKKDPTSKVLSSKRPCIRILGVVPCIYNWRDGDRSDGVLVPDQLTQMGMEELGCAAGKPRSSRGSSYRDARLLERITSRLQSMRVPVSQTQQRWGLASPRRSLQSNRMAQRIDKLRIPPLPNPTRHL